MAANNSAQRLSNILDRAIQINGSNMDTISIICLAMGSDPSEKHLIIDFLVLIQDVEVSISRLKNISKKQNHLDAIKEIKNLFLSHDLRIHDHWQIIKSNIQSKNLVLIIDSCANFIAQEFPVVDVTQEDLDKYLLECEALLNEVHKSDLATEIKTFLIIRLEEICSAIRHYSVGGSERLQKVIEANIGGMILQSVGMSSQDRKDPIIQRLFDWFLKLGALMGMVVDTQSLIQSASQIFLPPGK